MTTDDKSTPKIQTEPAKLEDLDEAVAELKKLKKTRDDKKEAARQAAKELAEAEKAYEDGMTARADVLRRLGPSYGVTELARHAELAHQQLGRILKNPKARS